MFRWSGYLASRLCWCISFKFEATYRSFGVQMQLARARDRTRDYGVEGVPSFVVNGKYMTSLGSAHGENRLFAILDKLIAGERTNK